MYLTLAIVIYKAFLSEWESRTLVILQIVLELIGNFADLGIVLRWNVALGIGDLTWLIFGSVAIQFFTMGFGFLIPFVLVSKITPAHVEATIFAFAASIINSTFGLGRIMGTVWNNLFHVDAENMDNLYKLLILQICLGAVCLCYVPLIPSWSAVENVQNKLQKLNSDNVVDLR